MTNGEKYKTAQERAEAFKRHCARTRCEECKTHGLNCTFAWLDLEYEEEKPLPCPFCGHAVSYRQSEIGEYIVCACGYSTNIQPSIKYAIAAHNRVAKKCMEGKE